ncbi:MAG TPA: ABC transporter substrate-binding protein [Stellaceae bacterium]|nr:ABC transporter substrate-binding protein [Stellaceae bacterium]
MALKRVIVAAAMLVALGTSAPAAEPQDNLIQQIKDRGTLRVCEASYPPYNVKNPATGVWEGLDIDLVKEIAAALGVKVEDVDSSFSTLIPSLQTHKCDMSAAATYVTPGRAEQVLFTTSYAGDSKTAFVPQGSTAKTYADIDKAGTVIAVRAGTAEETYAKKFFKNAQIKSLTSDATQVHLLEVGAGRADAAFAGYVGSLIFLKNNPNIKVRPLGDQPLDQSAFAFMVPLGEYHFQQYLDVVLASLERSGKLKEITEKWISVPR